jgi:predicted adenylyl cyclase CyaB
MKNLEIKAVASNLGRLRRLLASLGASRRPVLVQTDTYFVTPAARMKLRVRRGARTAELIVYDRPNASRARSSEYQKLPVDDPPGLLRLMRRMFGVHVRVRKRRDLWLLGETRVHLDSVEGLGSFVEIEVPYVGGASRARRTMARLLDALEIVPGDVLDRSYADLLAERAGR